MLPVRDSHPQLIVRLAAEHLPLTTALASPHTQPSHELLVTLDTNVAPPCPAPGNSTMNTNKYRAEQNNDIAKFSVLRKDLVELSSMLKIGTRKEDLRG